MYWITTEVTKFKTVLLKDTPSPIFDTPNYFHYSRTRSSVYLNEQPHIQNI